MLLGDIIKQYREEHNMSLQDFADLVHTSRSYIHMLEKNYNPSTGKPISPSIETLKSISNAMNTDIENILKQLDDDQDIYLDEEEYQKQFKDEKLNAIMKNCSERLKKCRINNNFSIEYISKIINVPINKIKRWEDGITSDIDNNTLNILASLYSVSPVWLMGYDDVPMEKTNSLDKKDSKIKFKFPILGLVKAGYDYFAEENCIGYISLDKDVSDIENYFALKVAGDSMQPILYENDYVVVHKQDDVDNGQVAIILINGDEATIKKVIKYNDHIELHAFNPYYPKKVLSKNDDFKIIGKVVEARISKVFE